MTAETKDKIKTAPLNQRALPRKLTAIEHAVMTWHLTPDPEVTPQDLMKPEFWAHTSTQLRPGHEVVVFAYDGAWHARLVCRYTQRATAHMGLLELTEFDGGVDVDVEDPIFKVAWRGPARRYGVVRLSDSEVVKEDIPTKEGAESWIKSQMKALAA